MNPEQLPRPTGGGGASTIPPRVEWTVDRTSKVKRFITSGLGITLIIFVSLLLLAGIVYALPPTRYAIMGVFIKRDIPVRVINAATKQPVSDAWVSIGSYGAHTDSAGNAMIKSVATGAYKLGGEKKFFEPVDPVTYTLDVGTQPKLITISLNPIGRSVNVVLRNKLTLAPVPQAKITMGETSGIAGDDGRATIIVRAQPTDARGEVKGEITAAGYELYRYTRQIEDVDGQAFNAEMMPSNDLYYLSRYNGTVDIVKTKLDGTSKEVVLKGTGKESSDDTRISSTVDQQYIALTSIRDTKKPLLYMFAVDTKKLTELETEDVTTEQVGWVGHDFIYLAHYKTKPWEAKQHILKSYNANSGKVTILYETRSSGENAETAASEIIGNVVLRDGRVLYGVYWTAAPGVDMKNKTRSLLETNVIGQDKRRIKEFSNPLVPIESRASSPIAAVVRTADNEYYRYDGQKIAHDPAMNNAAYSTMPKIYYIPAPNGQKYLWHEPAAGGLYTLKVGGADGKPTHTIGTGAYRAYGWVGNDYVILSRASNELFAVHEKGVFSDKVQPLRTTDYLSSTTANVHFGVGYGLW